MKVGGSASAFATTAFTETPVARLFRNVPVDHLLEVGDQRESAGSPDLVLAERAGPGRPDLAVVDEGLVHLSAQARLVGLAVRADQPDLQTLLVEHVPLAGHLWLTAADAVASVLGFGELAPVRHAVLSPGCSNRGHRSDGKPGASSAPLLAKMRTNVSARRRAHHETAGRLNVSPRALDHIVWRAASG